MRDLVNLYATKTDEELLRLAADPLQLTQEAHAALAGELSRRRLNIVEHLHTDEEQNQQASRPVTHTVRHFQPDEPGKFITEVLRLYHGNFWLFSKLMCPAVIIGYVAVFLSRRELREIVRHLPSNPYQHPSTILGIWLASVSGHVVSWFAFCISFGAICSAVLDTEVGANTSVSESFATVRRRCAPFLVLTLVLLFLCSVGIGFCGLLISGLVWLSVDHGVHVGRFALGAVSFLSWGLCLLVLSRFALAVPAVVLDRSRIGKSLFRSDELTEGRWLILAALLFKSIIGGYVAGMLPYWLAAWIPQGVALPSWFPWVLWGTSIAGVTFMEPPMFIGFALLYVRNSGASSAAVQELAPLEA